MGMNWISFSTKNFATLERFADDQDVLTVIREQPLEPLDMQKLQASKPMRKHGDRRIAPRFSVEVTVLIVTAQKSFRTASENISESGILLKDLLPPDFMNSPFEVLIFEKQQERASMMFRGHAVGGPLRTRRVTFKATNPQSQQNLGQLLADREPLPSAI